MAVTRKQSVNHSEQCFDDKLIANSTGNSSSLNGATLIEHILNGVGEREQEQSLFKRYGKLKVRYFNHHAKELMGNFLHVKHCHARSIDEILSANYRQHDKKEFIEIISSFITGEYDAVETACVLERYYLRNKPPMIRVFAAHRYNRLQAFIDVFKSNCMKYIC